MKRTDTIIIGGGQAGLAMSRSLSERRIDHIVLERGRVAERWRSERWDSLRLLTPRWQSRLPGWSYRGPAPDGFMTMPEVIRYLEGYADAIAAPVQDLTTVTSVAACGSGYMVDTDRGAWRVRNVVIATGQCDRPHVPTIGPLPSRIAQIVPSRYRNPERLPDGPVLVVGASASGVQLAAEIHDSGRPVTLAVGRHTRLPRTYRGRDIMFWLDQMGVLDETADDVGDVEASRRQPSLQLIGHPDRRSIDLAYLQAQGIRLVGRAVATEGERLWLAGDLPASIARADERLFTLLSRIDEHITRSGVPAPAAEPIRRIATDPAPASLDLRAEGIRTVLWATGYRRHYPWLRVPALDGRGEIKHRGGVTPHPGLYVLGLQFLRRRKSSFIDGVGADARELATHIANRCARPRVAA